MKFAMMQASLKEPLFLASRCFTSDAMEKACIVVLLAVTRFALVYFFHVCNIFIMSPPSSILGSRLCSAAPMNNRLSTTPLAVLEARFELQSMHNYTSSLAFVAFTSIRRLELLRKHLEIFKKCHP
jgi:hypothetical protein